MLALVAAPVVMFTSMISLLIFKRGLESLEFVSISPSSSLGSVQKQLKPFLKGIYDIIHRHWDMKVSINTSAILLTSLVVLSIVFIMEFKDAQTEAAKKKAKKE